MGSTIMYASLGLFVYGLRVVLQVLFFLDVFSFCVGTYHCLIVASLLELEGLLDMWRLWNFDGGDVFVDLGIRFLVFLFDQMSNRCW